MLLGEIVFPKVVFPQLDRVFSPFDQTSFLKKNEQQKSEEINRALLHLIQKEKEPAFLLAAVLDYIYRIDQKNYLSHYTLNSFELWLNQFSGISWEENLRIRGKIVGKWIPREEYQKIFPIGMNRVYEGSHFVTAHKSPDLDTTVASFWGWVDAFAARVGSHLHIWNVPGGPPPSQIEIQLIFYEIFGEAVFSHLAKTRTSLSITGTDLMKQKDLVRKTLEDKMSSVSPERGGQAIIVVDHEGYFLGDWRSIDVERVRQLIMLLNGCIRWFENQLHLKLITLFAKETLSISDIPQFLTEIFSLKIHHSEIVKEYPHQDKEYLESFLQQVFFLKKGLDATFEEFAEALAKLSIIDFQKVRHIFDSLKRAKLFDSTGKLLEDRPAIFSYLEKVVKKIHIAIQNVRLFLEKFGMALQIKSQVYGFKPKYVTLRSEVEEIRQKMGNYQHLTVVHPEKEKLFPLGIILAEDLRKAILGTVSLRDFCNREEMGIPSYLEVISVIDHHKSSLQTFSPPSVVIADAQSSNSLVFELAHAINEQFSTKNMSLDQVQKQLKTLQGKQDLVSLRKKRRLLTTQMILQQNLPYYIHPQRQMIESLHFLYAILDDTDLLSKVSVRDVEAIVSLLNTMKTLQMQQEVEIISLEEIPQGEEFAKLAAKKILQNEEMYSLYKKVYQYREKEVEKNLELCVQKQPSTIFSDTKEQNGCCRVGQTKLFAKNIPLLEKKGEKIRKIWRENAIDIHKDRPEYDLHLHMLSTIVGAEEVYQGKKARYKHKDQMWIWAAPTEAGLGHLKNFLSSFQECPQIKENKLYLELGGKDTKELEQIFQESFLPLEIGKNRSKEGPAFAILYYLAGSLNSRKAMISPYLPSVK